MADGKDPKDYYLQTGEITDVSDRKAVKFLTTKLSGDAVTISVDWDTQAYPNSLLNRVPLDDRGQLKPKVESAPPKVGEFGELYVAKALCEAHGLEQSKFPSELPSDVTYHRTMRQVKSLVMECKSNNGDFRRLNILSPSRVDMSRGLVLRGGLVEFWMSDEAFTDLGETAPESGHEPSNGRETTGVAPRSPAPELAALALDYCASLPDGQLRAVIVPLLRIIAGSK